MKKRCKNYNTTYDMQLHVKNWSIRHPNVETQKIELIPNQINTRLPKQINTDVLLGKLPKILRQSNYILTNDKWIRSDQGIEQRFFKKNNVAKQKSNQSWRNEIQSQYDISKILHFMWNQQLWHKPNTSSIWHMIFYGILLNQWNKTFLF